MPHNISSSEFGTIQKQPKWKVVKSDQTEIENAWRINKVEEDLEKECTERKENDKLLFEKFDKLNIMIIYQLCAAILTLVAVIAMYWK